MPIEYVDGRRFRAVLIAASARVRTARAELNRINVFPVPDGDTGTNLALTLESIVDRMRANRPTSFATAAAEAADAGIIGARGNCGMILSHFLLGLAQQSGSRARLNVAEFAAALRGAVDHLYAALDSPTEGTIVTVIRETAEEATAVATADFAVLTERLLHRARSALARTPDLLPALRVAGVVDAGAKGFVHLLEGAAACVRGEPVVGEASTDAAAGRGDAATLRPRPTPTGPPAAARAE
ncbi:MAG: DAK2 domain-containing protein, partial [Gemmatimonadota bacterium]